MHRVLWKELGNILSGGEAQKRFEPEGEVNPGEKLLGNMAGDSMVQNLYSLWRRIDQYKEDYLTAEGFIPGKVVKVTPAELEKHRHHLDTINRVDHAVSEAFWSRVEDQFPEVTNSSVERAVRAGWQVVVWKKSPSRPSAANSGFSDVLRVLDIYIDMMEELLPPEKKPEPPAAPEAPAPAVEPPPGQV